MSTTMPHPKKRPRLEEGRQSNDVAAVGNFFASMNSMSVDELAIVLGFLPPEDIMRARVNNKLREAAMITMVPPTNNFNVDSVKKYNAMGAMSIALPNLQRITLNNFFPGVAKYNDGEDPDEQQTAHTASHTTHDIEIISRFAKLRVLNIRTTQLNGRYPFFFNSFPLLQKLSIRFCPYLKFDLEMLVGLPMLKEVECDYNQSLCGNINSLRVLKDTLEKVHIGNCVGVEGNFMDLADFPCLNELYLDDTSVIGDIRDVGNNDFLSLKELTLPMSVYGGNGHEFQLISDAPDLIRTVYLLTKQRPSLLYNW